MAEASLPKVTVILPVRNEEKHLESAVRSVLDQDYQGELEVILAVAPSIDKTVEIANALSEKFPNLTVIENPKGLTTAGLNLAIAKSSGSIIARVDAHSELSQGYLREGIKTLREQKAVLVGGIMRSRGKSPLQKAVAFGYSSRLGLGGGRYHVGGSAGEAESAYLGIFEKAALVAVSGYDEKVIRGEDWDLAQRLKANGGLVWFDPNLVVDYWPRANLKALAWQFYSTGVWRGELTRRNLKATSVRFFAPPIALLALVLLSVFTFTGVTNWAWLIIPIALYIGALGVGAVLARGIDLLSRAAILIALPTMHFSWAAGFWIGFIFGAGKTIDSGEKR
jgi:succinoglycan biosynthesis protein ExoA